MHRAPGAVTLLTTILLAVPGCRPAPTPSPATPRDTPALTRGGEAESSETAGRLLGLMRDRLVLMHDVARSKWNARRPVSDPQRERALLGEMERQAKEHGLDARFTRAFFAAQIDAAKRLQEADLARWQAAGQGPFEAPPDLAALRERIDGLNRQLLGALARSGPWPVAPAGRERVRSWARQAVVGEGIDDAVRDEAVAPLLGLTSYGTQAAQ